MSTRDPRTYIRLHDSMPDHPKIVGLSDRAFRTLIEVWCWCGRHLTDGNVPEAQWRRFSTKKTREELQNSGLVEVGIGAVQVHDFLEFQRSAAEVTRLRENRRNAGAQGGKSKAERVANGVASATAGAKQVAKQNGKQTASTLPIYREEEEEELETSSSSLKEKSRKRSTRLPDDWLPTEKDVAWQRDERIPDDLARRELPKFHDHWRAESGPKSTKLDWSAAWKNWLRRAQEWASTSTSNGRGHRAVSPDGLTYVGADGRQRAMPASGRLQAE